VVGWPTQVGAGQGSASCLKPLLFTYHPDCTLFRRLKLYLTLWFRHQRIPGPLLHPISHLGILNHLVRPFWNEHY